MKRFNVKGINFRKVGRSLKTCWNKNNQVILAVVAGTCAVGAVFESGKATLKATKIHEERKEKIDKLTIRLQEGKISASDYKAKTRAVNFRAAKEYALTYGTTCALLALSLGSTACNYKISIGKQAALLGAYKALELTSGEFSDKVKEVVGDKKFDEIRHGIIKDQLDKAEIPDTIKPPEYEKDADGNFLAKQYLYPCWDAQSGRPFMGSVSAIDTAMAKASNICIDRNESQITFNEIYELLDPTGIYLPANDFGETYGYLASDLKNNGYRIPYHTRAMDKEGYDHSFTALIFDLPPVNLVIDNDY